MKRRRGVPKFYLKDLPLIRKILSVLLLSCRDSEVVLQTRNLINDLKRRDRKDFNFNEAALIAVAAAEYLESFSGDKKLRDLFYRSLYHVVYKEAVKISETYCGRDKSIKYPIMFIGDTHAAKGMEATGSKSRRHKVLLDKSK